jgi:hypothetical protein
MAANRGRAGDGWVLRTGLECVENRALLGGSPGSVGFPHTPPPARRAATAVGCAGGRRQKQHPDFLPSHQSGRGVTPIQASSRSGGADFGAD